MLNNRVHLMIVVVTLGAGLIVPPLAYAAKPGSNERVTNADFPTQLRPEPDSLVSTAKIPAGTTVTVVDMRVVRVGKFKENWYRVDYEDKTGWVRGDDLDGETAEKNYSVTYQAPELAGNSLNGISF